MPRHAARQSSGGREMTDDGSPGSHPHSDRPNWQQAETIADYARNIREGLEEYSDRRAAKLLGRSRIHVYRAKLMAELPNALFERLLGRRLIKSHAGPPATLGSTAAAGAHLLVWCRACRHRVEPDPAAMAERYGADTAVRNTRKDRLSWWEAVIRFPGIDSSRCSEIESPKCSRLRIECLE